MSGGGKNGVSGVDIFTIVVPERCAERVSNLESEVQRLESLIDALTASVAFKYDVDVTLATHATREELEATCVACEMKVDALRASSDSFQVRIDTSIEAAFKKLVTVTRALDFKADISNVATRENLDRSKESTLKHVAILESALERKADYDAVITRECLDALEATMANELTTIVETLHAKVSECLDVLHKNLAAMELSSERKRRRANRSPRGGAVHGRDVRLAIAGQSLQNGEPYVETRHWGQDGVQSAIDGQSLQNGEPYAESPPLYEKVRGQDGDRLAIADKTFQSAEPQDEDRCASADPYHIESPVTKSARTGWVPTSSRGANVAKRGASRSSTL